jgi:hypothetical protein
VRFLIDECLSVHLVAVARQAGHDAHHVAHVGRAGWKDWNVAGYARDGNFHFRHQQRERLSAPLCGATPACRARHSCPAVHRDLQQRLFKAALDEFATIGEPVNRVLEVDLDGDDVTLALYDFPSAAP